MLNSATEDDQIFRTVLLDGESAKRAFSLVKLFRHELQLAAWQNFVDAFVASPPHEAGLVAFKDARGYIHALFSYRIIPSLHYGKLLNVTDMIIANLGGRYLLRLVLDRANWIGAEYACNSILLDFVRPLSEQMVGEDFLAAKGFQPVQRGFLHALTAA
jgi:hypothetical protein